MTNYTAVEIAKYFLSKDKDKTVFTNNLTTKKNHTFYDGNARLNKYLHLAQNLHLAKYGTPLFTDTLLAYDNGAVAFNVQKKYMSLKKSNLSTDIDSETKMFLDKIYDTFKDASVDELIEISHEDNEWKEKNSGTSYYMDSISRKDEYRTQYADLLYLMFDAVESDFDDVED